MYEKIIMVDLKIMFIQEKVDISKRESRGYQ